MIKTKSIFYIFLLIATMLLTTYFVSIFFELTSLSNVLSPAITALAAAILLYSYQISDLKKTIGIISIMYFLAAFTWTLADILWVQCYFNGTDPETVSIITFVYFLPNLFLFLAVTIYLFYQYTKWDSFSLLLDTIVVCILSLLMIWIGFFQKESAWVQILTQNGYISFFSIIIDFLIIIGNLITIVSIRQGKIPTYMKIITAGLFIFTFNDLHYYYSQIYEALIPSALSDLIYAPALMIIAFGTFYKTIYFSTDDFSNVSNIGNSRNGGKWIFLFFFPILTIFVEGLFWPDILNYLAIISFYLLLNSQIQLAKTNRKLYHSELEINDILEKRVNAQFGELTYLVNHDTLTKLYNRHYFMNFLEDAVKSILTNEILAVFVIDIDRFKKIGSMSNVVVELK